MKTICASVLGVLLMAVSSFSLASGPFGFCALVERVEFEPGDGAPERIRIYGAFVRYDGEPGGLRGIRPPAERGYMYFQLPPNATDGQKALLRREWKDLAAVAGTGTAVAFSSFNLSFGVVAGDGTGGVIQDYAHFSVRAEDAAPENPATYTSSGLGIVPLGEGNLDYIVRALNAALER
jgi:hypothetical protein